MLFYDKNVIKHEKNHIYPFYVDIMENNSQNDLYFLYMLTVQLLFYLYYNLKVISNLYTYIWNY